MAEKTKKAKALAKKNLIYIIWIAALVSVVAAAIIIAVSVSAHRSGKIINNGGASIVSDTESKDTANTDSSPEPADSTIPDDSSGEEEDKTDTTDAPTSGKVTFIMPCEGATVLKDYTADTVVFNSTLGAYMGHMGVDYAAKAGTEVVCVYDGVIESITTSYLTGTTVTINHGNDLKTVYNSIDANEALYEGAKVSRGASIGTISDNNLQEYKDGAHLHFEVWKDGARVDPDEYLIGEEK